MVVTIAHYVDRVAKAVTVEGTRFEVESFILENGQLFNTNRAVDEAKELRK